MGLSKKEKEYIFKAYIATLVTGFAAYCLQIGYDSVVIVGVFTFLGALVGVKILQGSKE